MSGRVSWGSKKVREPELTAVVLAGVHDWGACALNQAVIRPLAPIANMPVVGYVLRALVTARVRRAILCTNGHGDAFREAIGDGSAFGLELSIRDDDMPRGPAGCLKDAYADLEGDCLVMESSLIPHFDIQQLVADHRSTGAAVTIASQKTQKAGMDHYSPVGVYVFSPEVVEEISSTGFVDIKENVLPRLHHEGKRVDVHVVDGPTPHLQGIASYFSLNEWAVKMAARGAFDLDEHYLDGETLVHIHAEVDPTARMMGPVVIGPGARIRAGAIIVGPTSVGQDSIVGQNCVISRSALWDNTTIGNDAQVDRCVVGKTARVEESVQMFNSVCVPLQPKRSRFLPKTRISHPKNDPSPTQGETEDAVRRQLMT